MSNYTCCEKAYIRGLSDGGMSVKHIAEKMKRSVSGIYDVLSRNEEDRDTEQGRPKKLTERGRRSIITYVKKNRKATLNEIKNHCPDDISKSTIRRVLHNAGIERQI